MSDNGGEIMAIYSHGWGLKFLNFGWVDLMKKLKFGWVDLMKKLDFWMGLV